MNAKTKMQKYRKRVQTGVKLLLIVVMISFLAFIGQNQVKIHKLRERKEEISVMIDMQVQKEEEYLRELESVGTDEYYEYMARKNLGYIYPDEKYLITVDENGNVIE